MFEGLDGGEEDGYHETAKQKCREKQEDYLAEET
jgi:hypothetical protein